VVTRPVCAGDEIFVSYGADYWRKSRDHSHVTTGVPDWEWDVSDPFAAVPSGLSFAIPAHVMCTVPLSTGTMAVVPSTSMVVAPSTACVAVPFVLKCRSPGVVGFLSRLLNNSFSIDQSTTFTSSSITVGGVLTFFDSRTRRAVDFWRDRPGVPSPFLNWTRHSIF